MVAQKFSRKCEGNIGEAVEEEKNYMKWKQQRSLHTVVTG